LAHRIALYLLAIGIEPVAPAGATQREIQAAYDRQWAALPLYWRSRAKRLVQTQVMATGLAHSLATAPFASAVTPPKQDPGPKAETLSMLCPHCRMRGGFPKRAWISRQLAEEALLRALEIPKNFTGLHVYECPHTQGYWHLGHRREDNVKPRGEPRGKRWRLPRWFVAAGLSISHQVIRFFESQASDE
jgi:hypothetical protein